uniref:Lipocalin/cytosolic fatty-acid binding domain-containing protein n=1 Tax=Amblyomma maculatum TaxID=34609 RepID=G3MKH0_AMBMU
MTAKNVCSTILIIMVTMALPIRALGNPESGGATKYADIVKFVNTSEPVLIYSLIANSNILCKVDFYEGTTSTSTLIRRFNFGIERGGDRRRQHPSGGRTGQNIRWHRETLEGKFKKYNEQTYNGLDTMDTYKAKSPSSSHQVEKQNSAQKKNDDNSYTTEVIENQSADNKCAIFSTRYNQNPGHPHAYEVRVWMSAIEENGDIECSSFVQPFVNSFKGVRQGALSRQLISWCRNKCIENGHCQSNTPDTS